MFVKIKEMKINGDNADTPFYISLDSSDVITIKFEPDVKNDFQLKFED